MNHFGESEVEKDLELWHMLAHGTRCGLTKEPKGRPFDWIVGQNQPPLLFSTLWCPYCSNGPTLMKLDLRDCHTVFNLASSA